jgi:hypothetical protein
LEKVWGRHNPTIRVVSGAYKSEYGDSTDISKTLSMVEVNIYVDQFYLYMVIETLFRNLFKKLEDGREY